MTEMTEKTEKIIAPEVEEEALGTVRKLIMQRENALAWQEITDPRQFFPNSKYEIGQSKTYDGKKAWTIRPRSGVLHWLTFVIPVEWLVYADGNPSNPLDSSLSKLSSKMTERLKQLLDGIELYEGTIEVLFGAYWYDAVEDRHYFEVEIMPNASGVTHMLLVNDWDRSLDWESTGQPQNPREAYRKGVIHTRANTSKQAVDKTPLAGCNQLIFGVGQWEEMRNFRTDLAEQRRKVYTAAREILRQTDMLPATDDETVGDEAVDSIVEDGTNPETEKPTLPNSSARLADEELPQAIS